MNKRAFAMLIALVGVVIMASTAMGDPPPYQSEWGDVGSAPGDFRSPCGVAMHAGHVYVADRYNYRIQVFTPGGTYVTEWGREGSGFPVKKGWYPLGLDVDEAGNIYVSHGDGKKKAGVRVFDVDGNYLYEWGGAGSAPGVMRYPRGVAVDEQHVYIADTGDACIKKFTHAGDFVEQWTDFNGLALSEPSDVAVDPCGHLYVTDTDNRAVYKVSTDGEYVAHWDSYTENGKPQHFNGMEAVGVGDCGTVYVSDVYRKGQKIIKLTSDGQFLSSWGGYGEKPGELNGPEGIVVDVNGVVLVADTGNNRLQRFSVEGAFELAWGKRGAKKGYFNRPYDCAVSSVGRIYVADMGNRRIQYFTSEGKYVGEFGKKLKLSYPTGIAINNDDVVYIADRNNHRIIKCDWKGNLLGAWGEKGKGDGEFYYPMSVGVGPDGNVYVFDRSNYRIQWFDPDGLYLGQWGSRGSGPGQFDAKEGNVTVHPDGGVYVADLGNNRVQKFTAQGDFLMQWGGYGVDVGQFDGPVGLAVHSDGSMYVSEVRNGRIQKFTADGNFIDTWGLRGSAPGEFGKPAGMAMDADDYLYVADTAYHRINKFMTSEPVRVSVSGVVTSSCMGPLAGIEVDVIDPQGGFHTALTAEDGSYEIGGLPCFPCDGEISVVLPLGFHAITPADGHTDLCLTENQVVDFDLGCLEATGNARSMGYWKHQTNVYLKGRGNGHETQEDMEINYPLALFDHFHENTLNNIAVEGLTYVEGMEGPEAVTLAMMNEILVAKRAHTRLDRAKQHYMALLLNVASGKIPTFTVVTEDDRTASEVLQYVADMILDEDSGNDELAKDLAESLNDADQLPAGSVPESYSYIAYRRDRGILPIVATPNPGHGPCTFALNLPKEGPVRLELFDLTGRLVATPFAGEARTGEFLVNWDGNSSLGRQLPRGIYFARLSHAAGTEKVKLVILSQ